MKRYLISILTLVTFTLVFGPVLLYRFTKPDGRKYRGVRLAETQFSEITFRNENRNITLGGMLFAPAGKGPFPIAVIIHGSGSSSRDNGWYLTLTKYMQDNGVAVLLPDKRGSEKSKGNWRSSSFEDLATDTLAAIEFLKKQNDLLISKVGIIGMSEGGRIAPIVAKNSSDLDFVVNVVGGAMSSHEQLFYEENYNVQQMGFLPKISNVISYFSTYSLIYVRQKDFWDAVGDFDPLPYWEKVTTSSLILYGEDDTNVNSAESAKRLNALKNPRIKVKIFKRSGHALEDPLGTGDSIFRDDALRNIKDFIVFDHPKKQTSEIRNLK